jgi:hypothetical protein
MSRTRTILSMIVAALVVTATIALPGAVAGKNGKSASQLIGTWTATAVRPAPLPPVTSLQMYAPRGVFVESGNDALTRSPQYGVWERIGGRTYAATGVFHRFNTQGDYIGSQKISRTIELAPDGETFAAVARVTVLDADGNTLASVLVRGTAARMHVERIPEQP